MIVEVQQVSSAYLRYADEILLFFNEDEDENTTTLRFSF
jgi:hypothetical protein